MFRKYLVAALVLSLAVTAGTAQAQRPLKVGIAGGVSLPTGDLSDVANTGFNIAAQFEFKPAIVPFGLRLEAAYDRFGLDEDAVGTSGNISSLSATINGIVDIPSNTPVKVYFIGGLGLYNLDGELNVGSGTTVSGDSENKFGFNLGGGLRLPFGTLDSFIEARYHKATDSDVSFIPITVGIRF